MTCPLCGDRGVIRVRYHDGSPDDFGICRCARGLELRAPSHGYPLWWVWAARKRVAHERVFYVEELLEDDELTAIPAAGDDEKRASSIAAVMQLQGGRR